MIKSRLNSDKSRCERHERVIKLKTVNIRIIADITDSGRASIDGNIVTYEMEPETVSLLVILKD